MRYYYGGKTLADLTKVTGHPQPDMCVCAIPSHSQIRRVITTTTHPNSFSSPLSLSFRSFYLSSATTFSPTPSLSLFIPIHIANLSLFTPSLQLNCV
ncbi:hypothetical protein RJT34_31563 [Clitoria ternatea]|uniref:Uncharacterized protein n=1 Tax=Clitoria ternatea TaxID=43366 RepID=A0AAN9I1G6_CLITE